MLFGILKDIQGFEWMEKRRSYSCLSKIKREETFSLDIIRSQKFNMLILFIPNSSHDLINIIIS